MEGGGILHSFSPQARSLADFSPHKRGVNCDKMYIYFQRNVPNFLSNSNFTNKQIQFSPNIQFLHWNIKKFAYESFSTWQNFSPQVLLVMRYERGLAKNQYYCFNDDDDVDDDDDDSSHAPSVKGKRVWGKPVSPSEQCCCCSTESTIHPFISGYCTGKALYINQFE